MEQDGTDGIKSEIGWAIRQLPGGAREWEKEECKHMHIPSPHLLKIRVIPQFGERARGGEAGGIAETQCLNTIFCRMSTHG
jgi:hypothetical protein